MNGPTKEDIAGYGAHATAARDAIALSRRPPGATWFWRGLWRNDEPGGIFDSVTFQRIK